MTSIIKVDCIVRKDTEYRRVEFARRYTVDVAGEPVSIVTAEDLILSKLEWAKDSHSALQLNDVRNLIDSMPTLDWTYLEGWAERLNVTNLLNEARR